MAIKMEDYVEEMGRIMGEAIARRQDDIMMGRAKTKPPTWKEKIANYLRDLANKIEDR